MLRVKQNQEPALAGIRVVPRIYASSLTMGMELFLRCKDCVLCRILLGDDDRKG